MKEKLQNGLRRAVAEFNQLVEGLSTEDFERPFGPKWSAGQDLRHVVRTLRAVDLAFSLPLPVLRLLFGKPNRKGRSEAELREKYRKALGKGFQAPWIYRPGKVGVGARASLTARHVRIAERLCRKVETLQDDQLDGYLLPHPAMGKCTLREMVVFSFLHTEHHTRLLKAKLEGTAADEL
jgi:hypothetical protein